MMKALGPLPSEIVPIALPDGLSSIGAIDRIERLIEELAASHNDQTITVVDGVLKQVIDERI